MNIPLRTITFGTAPQIMKVVPLTDSTQFLSDQRLAKAMFYTFAALTVIYVGYQVFKEKEG